MRDRVELPQSLVRALRTFPSPVLRAWVRRLPGTLAAVAERWELTLGRPFQPGGTGSWVAPVRTAAGGDLVLKVALRHVESEHEPEALRLWDGDGAVRLHRADRDDDTTYLLLERGCDDRRLGGEPAGCQDEVVAGLLRRLWVEPPPGHPFRPLTQMCAEWVAEHQQQPGPAPFDPGLARAGVALFGSLAATSTQQRLLLTDLHAGNVLAAERELWLAIDPKPYVGDPAYDPLQHLLNSPDRLRADPHGMVARMADLCGVDRERLGLWLFARCVLEGSSLDGESLLGIAEALAP